VDEETVRIREVSKADAAVIARIVSEAFQDVAAMFNFTPQNCPTFPAFCQPDWIAEAFEKGRRFFIASLHGEATGCVGMTAPKDDACELVRLAVLPGHRHSGLGAKLVGHIMEQAQGLGLVRVDLAIVAENTRLLHWYERLGFAVTHKTRYPHLPFEVAYMSRRLT
jgi:N-acetylglutamate synthase-like GNAT family acetyltransferase